MANAYYEVRHDDITVDNEEELDELSVQGYEEVQIPRLQVWPVNIGIVLIVFGFITVCLGVLELFYLPLIMIDYEIVPILRKSNCYGAGFFAGVFMVLTGSTAVRSSISKRPTSVRKFFNLTIFTLMLYVSSSVLLIYGYGKKWTTSDNYPENSYLYEVHIFVTVVNMLGFLFVVTAFVNYYEVIFCGDFQLCFSWFSFCRRCWCCRHRVCHVSSYCLLGHCEQWTHCFYSNKQWINRIVDTRVSVVHVACLASLVFVKLAQGILTTALLIIATIVQTAASLPHVYLSRGVQTSALKRFVSVVLTTVSIDTDVLCRVSLTGFFDLDL